MYPLRILLVDDDPEFAYVAGDALRGDGHEVVVAVDGAMALTLALTMRPDVVLLDLGLPDDDGYNVARALRRDLPSTTPIIIVTAQRKAGLAVNGDVDLTLSKPVASELFSGLIEFIRRRRLNAMVDR